MECDSNSQIITDDALNEFEEKDPSLHSITFSYGSRWPNSILWSTDGRIGVLTDSCIYILMIANSNKRKNAGVSLGLKVEATFIPEIPTKVYESNIKRDEFGNRSQKTFRQRAKYLLDRSTLHREDFLSNNDKYVLFRWSPMGFTSDGRCCIATLGANGIVHVQLPDKDVGKWRTVANITDCLYEHLLSKNWLHESNATSSDNEERNLELDFEEHRWRKHILFTTIICWCPVTSSCMKCFLNSNPENTYYTNYVRNFVKCKHSLLMLLTGSRSGHLFLWLIEFDALSENAVVKLLHYWKSSLVNSWPSSLSWCQQTDTEAYIATGYTNGCVVVHEMQFEQGSWSCQDICSLKVWEDVDLLNVTFLEWVMPKDSVLRLIAAKGTEVVLFKIAKNSDGKLTCLSCEIGPSCHASPITSLQCVNNKFILTSSDAATQYFDIDNESLPFGENNILRGFRCLGINGDKNMCMLVRVSCADRFLLHQVAFVKQMEISFLPFLSPTILAESLLSQSVHLDMIVREYFSISASEGFVLPDVIHKYCDEPDDYNKSLRELQIYLYFNQLRYMRQTGLRENSLTREDVDADTLEHTFNDPVIEKLERNIELVYFSDMLSKCIQLLDKGWLKHSEKGDLTLHLICDLLITNNFSDVTRDLAKKYFTLSEDERSLHLLDQVACVAKNNVENKAQRKRPSNETSECPSGDFPEENNDSTWKIYREKCPYCHIDVYLVTPTMFNCRNGHVLPRCSVTLRVMMNSQSRRCTTCNRRVFQKCFDGELNVDSLLLNVDICPFCGCEFVNT